MQERGELRSVKHRNRSSEGFGKEVRFEGDEEGQGNRGAWNLPRAGLSRDAGGQEEGTLRNEHWKLCALKTSHQSDSLLESCGDVGHGCGCSHHSRSRT